MNVRFRDRDGNSSALLRSRYKQAFLIRGVLKILLTTRVSQSLFAVLMRVLFRRGRKGFEYNFSTFKRRIHITYTFIDIEIFFFFFGEEYLPRIFRRNSISVYIKKRNFTKLVVTSIFAVTRARRKISQGLDVARPVRVMQAAPNCINVQPIVSRRGSRRAWLRKREMLRIALNCRT